MKYRSKESDVEKINKKQEKTNLELQENVGFANQLRQEKEKVYKLLEIERIENDKKEIELKKGEKEENLKQQEIKILKEEIDSLKDDMKEKHNKCEKYKKDIEAAARANNELEKKT